MKTPLIAKLYLDRVNNRLLAGLEFHYENMDDKSIGKRESQTGPMLIRDKEKEKKILKFMEDSSFFQTESGYFLHNEELEYDFLFNVVPKLQNACPNLCDYCSEKPCIQWEYSTYDSGENEKRADELAGI